ncbi:putative sensor domain DACNV-containing protein [Anatilimnocola floriformis]|uniref:putative sensor domain DACNV-containing protein n=1 Tax=Anatilimnocola floriformis TaxID=2948575 RepID=UPI0020C3F06E|nr:hypothetical protein [Anatilimnocola floriformis]
MASKESELPGCGRNSGSCSYPHELAQFVRDRWDSATASISDGSLLPDTAILENFFSGCYHASMLREEERPVTFRAILASPTLFFADDQPPEGLLRLDFSRSYRFHPSELRRLSVAADSHRTLIGVQPDKSEGGGLRIWGLINSGTRWLRDVEGGRLAGPSLPPVPVVRVEAPGSIEVYKVHELVGKLLGGKLSGARRDLFDSAWLPVQFVQFRERLLEQHEVARKCARAAGSEWAPLQPSLPRQISERMMKRVISMLREARHGGTIVFVPTEKANDLAIPDSYVDVKYSFANGPGRLSFPDLIVTILNRLAQVQGSSDQNPHEPVGWQHFEATTDTKLALLDEALFETAHLIANMAAADGAVVLTKQHELLGFGGMISGKLPSVKTVVKALDLEGEIVVEEEIGNVGARHLSAYRLTSGMPGAVAMVISQDGGVRFVCQKQGRVTYWEQE